MMLDVKEITKALRWRLIPVRYAGKVRRSMSPRRAPAPRTELAECVRQTGHSPGPTIDQQTIESILEIYRPRAAQVKSSSVISGKAPLIRDGAERAVATARVVRPDFNGKYLRAVFDA